MFAALRNLFSRRSEHSTGQTLHLRRKERGDAGQVAASYDAAKTNELNSRYWRNADLLSADRANSADVRRTLRSRSRYEIHEAYGVGKGIVDTLANDTIGRGPRLQVLSQNAETNRSIEEEFKKWAQRVRRVARPTSLWPDAEGTGRCGFNVCFSSTHVELTSVVVRQTTSQTADDDPFRTIGLQLRPTSVAPERHEMDVLFVVVNSSPDHGVLPSDRPSLPGNARGRCALLSLRDPATQRGRATPRGVSPLLQPAAAQVREPGPPCVVGNVSGETSSCDPTASLADASGYYDNVDRAGVAFLQIRCYIRGSSPP
ncbi:MAG: hypothetical protein CMJ48_08015 [Planctomycetaceae bacterium]|nr:hypothetical protein [Planctomycetaceae bacterium]